MVDSGRFYDAQDMAYIYRAPTSGAFLQRFARDKARPAELRRYPDEINPDRKRNESPLWSPGEVQRRLNGEKPTKSVRR